MTNAAEDKERMGDALKLLLETLAAASRESRSHSGIDAAIVLEKVVALGKLLDERELRYSERSDTQQKALETAMVAQQKALDAAMAAQDKALAVAMAAQDKLTNTIFSSNQRAIDKSEEAQQNYNNRSNEFRAALDDAQKTMISRTEAAGELSRLHEKIEESKKEIHALRDITTRMQGRDAGMSIVWGIIIAIATFLSSSGMALFLTRR